MIVNSSAAAKSLLEALEMVKSNAAVWRAVHVYIPSMKNSWDMMNLQTAIQNIRKCIPDHYMAQAFFCETGDVFILLRDASAELMAKVQEITVLSLSKGQECREVTKTLYELGTQWSQLKEMTAKISIESQKYLVVKEMPVDERVNHVLSRTNMNFVQSLIKLREKRKHLHILIAEDDDLLQQYVSSMLTDYTLIKARKGEDVLVSYLLNAPDMVFLDIELPEINGHRLLEEMKKVDRDVFAVMMSGHTQMKHVKRSIQAGAKGFVAKPFQKEKIKSCVEACANLKGLYAMSG